MVPSAVPVFETVILRVTVVPTGTFPKSIAVGDATNLGVRGAVLPITAVVDDGGGDAVLDDGGGDAVLDDGGGDVDCIAMRGGRPPQAIVKIKSESSTVSR
jgi:hypothetical protein